ncbi:hypothetical protein ACFQJD_16370 [Haloplanus sp. GCM10025708]|uniref:hypothetical protein n=1 Tax=Haloplanus sp. GCM10025708 TaxID=3252679 RepID=UPI00361FA47E
MGVSPSTRSNVATGGERRCRRATPTAYDDRWVFPSSYVTRSRTPFFESKSDRL